MPELLEIQHPRGRGNPGRGLSSSFQAVGWSSLAEIEQVSPGLANQGIVTLSHRRWFGGDHVTQLSRASGSCELKLLGMEASGHFCTLTLLETKARRGVKGTKTRKWQLPDDTEGLDTADTCSSLPQNVCIMKLCGLTCDSDRWVSVILCPHPPVPYPDACRAAFEHSIRNGGPRRVNHRDKSREAEATTREVHCLHVEGIARWVVLLIQVELAET